MTIVTTIINPTIAAKTIHTFISDVSGTSEVIDVLMDLWMYANENPAFHDLSDTCRSNMFFTLKNTLKFVAEMEGSVKTEYKK